jgi:NhaA family Na+:H+ antiporter
MRNTKPLQNWTDQDSFPGILLISASILALIVANSPFHDVYQRLLTSEFYVGFNDYSLRKPLLLWINEGLMAVFFMLIGLELKREFFEGHLSSLSQIVLPGVAALGGVIVPVLIYTYFNYAHSLAMRGWAIPAATDIAFALGILALLGSRVHISLKIFLMALAIFDDLLAIIIIALFYTADLSTMSLLLACIGIGVLISLNYFKIGYIPLYLCVGVLLWIFVLKSGVHATLAGVVLAFCIPLKTGTTVKHYPLAYLEKNLYPWVNFLIVPLFAFANAGVPFLGVSTEMLTSPITLGIFWGLFLGKQLGIFIFSYILIKFNLAQLPVGASWKQFYGVAVLGGIGFTMSLFIGTLAFGQQETVTSRIGILAGSLLSMILGYLILMRTKTHHLN